MCIARCADKLLVTLAPDLPPAQQLCRANMRPKYGPSPQWAAKNSKLSLGEQRFIIRVFNYLSENGVPTTKKLISLVISVRLASHLSPRSFFASLLFHSFFLFFASLLFLFSYLYCPVN